MTRNLFEDDYHLHRLCRQGSVDDIDNFLKQSGNSHIDAYDKKGYAPVHYAVKRESADIEKVLDILVSHQVNVNTRSLRDGETALHLVAKSLPVEDATTLCLSLLAQGADPDYRNDKYRTAYDIAMARGMLDLSNYLSSDLTAETAHQQLEHFRQKHYGLKLVQSVIDGNLVDLEACLKQGADPNQLNQHGAAAIHYTVTHCPLNKQDILQKLINAGADVSKQDYEGDTALNLIIKTSSLHPDDRMYTLSRTLLEHGCDQTLKDIDGNNALELATNRGYDDIVALLKSNGTPSNKEADYDQPYDDSTHLE